MALSTGNGDGSAPTSGFDIPAPDFVAQGKAQATGAIQADVSGDFWRKYFIGHATGIQALINLFVTTVDYLAADVISLFGAFQGQGAPGFYDLIAVILGDLLGVEINEQDIIETFARKGSLATFRKIGQAYWNTVTGELQSPNPLTPQGGLAAAQAWLGYILGFTVREGNIAVISEMLPELLDPLKGFKEYGEGMRNALGLGRLTRQVLHPLIQTLITDPLQWYVNQQYQPKLMGEGAATRAYNRGLIDNGAWYQEMSYAGYNPARSAALQAEYLGHLSAPDVQTLREQGTLSDQQAVDALKNSSYDPTTAAQLLAVFDANSTRPYVSQQISTLRTQRLNGFLDDAGFQAEVNNLAIGAPAQGAVKHAMAVEMGLPRKTLSWTDVQEALARGFLSENDAIQFLTQQGYSDRDAGVLLQLPRAKLTLAQLQSAFTEGLLDSTDVSAWLKAEGYGDDDAQVLWLQTLMKLGTEQAKIAVAQYAYNKAVAKAEKAGEPTPPKPPILAQGPT